MRMMRGLGQLAVPPVLDNLLQPPGKHQVSEQRVSLPRLDHQAHGHAVDHRLHADPSSEAHEGVDIRSKTHLRDLLSRNSHPALVADELQLVWTEGKEPHVLVRIEQAVMPLGRTSDEHHGPRRKRPSQSQIAHRIAPDPAVLEQAEPVQG